MDNYDLSFETVKILIEKVKRQDYKMGKYLEDNITFSDEGIMMSGDKNIILAFLNRVFVNDDN